MAECHKRALTAIESLKEERTYSYVLGRLGTLDNIFKNECLNKELGLKRLHAGEKWNPEMNNQFIDLVVDDLDRHNKPVYALVDSRYYNGQEDIPLEQQFTHNFVNDVPDKRHASMYALEMSQVLTVKDIGIREDVEKGALMPKGVKIFEISKTRKGCSKQSLTPKDLKHTLNRILSPPPPTAVPALPTPSITRGRGRLGPRAKGGSSRPGPGKLLLAGHWRKKHIVTIEKKKSIDVVKYNGVYVPVSFVEHVAKR